MKAIQHGTPLDGLTEDVIANQHDEVETQVNWLVFGGR
jgi:hypothetical protein